MQEMQVSFQVVDDVFGGSKNKGNTYIYIYIYIYNTRLGGSRLGAAILLLLVVLMCCHTLYSFGAFFCWSTGENDHGLVQLPKPIKQQNEQ